MSCQCGDSVSQNASGKLSAQLSADACWTGSVTVDRKKSFSSKVHLLTFLSTVFEDYDLVLKGQEGAFTLKGRFYKH